MTILHHKFEIENILGVNINEYDHNVEIWDPYKLGFHLEIQTPADGKKKNQKTHKHGLEREQINTRVTLLNAIKLLLALQRQVPNREVRNQSQR